MFLPSLPRNLEASFRDLSSLKADTRRSALADVVRHALGDDATRTRAIPAIEKLLDDDVAEVRAAAAVALGDLHAQEALPKILLAVEDAHPMVRQMAINALGEIGDQRGEQRLSRALSDARPEVRYQALIAYARVAKDAGDVGRALARALADDDDAIKHIALRIAEERADEGEAPDEIVLKKAASLLGSSHPDVACASAVLLGKAGDERARRLIREVVTTGQCGGRRPSKEEEQAAVELAGFIDARDLEPALTRRAWGFGRHFSDTCAFAAKVALAALGEERATKELEALAAKNDVAGEAARAALARIAAKKSRAESKDES
jgi:HEAT repeat protein